MLQYVANFSTNAHLGTKRLFSTFKKSKKFRILYLYFKRYKIHKRENIIHFIYRYIADAAWMRPISTIKCVICFSGSILFAIEVATVY